jgi:hypothetical protein
MDWSHRKNRFVCGSEKFAMTAKSFVHFSIGYNFGYSKAYNCQVQASVSCVPQSEIRRLLTFGWRSIKISESQCYFSVNTATNGNVYETSTNVYELIFVDLQRC